MSTQTRQDQPPFGWLSFGPAVLTGAGVLLYGVLNISYSLFYGHLGINPEDVGLTYVSTLTRSTGFVVFVLGIFIFGIAPLLWTRLINRRVAQYQGQELARTLAQLDKDNELLNERIAEEETYLRSRMLQVETRVGVGATEEVKMLRERAEELGRYAERNREEFNSRRDSLTKEQDELSRYTQRLSGRGMIAASSVVVISIIALACLIPLRALPRVDQVRAGEEVSPIRVPGLTVLAIHADRATIQATGKPEETKVINELRSKPLLHLGQSSGMHVFYQSDSREVVYVPSSSVLVKVHN